MESLPNRIRLAISREDYVEALELWKTYSEALRDEISHGHPDPNEWTEIRELVEWARPVLRNARIHLQLQSHQASSAAAYLPRSLPSNRIRASL